MSQFLIGKVKSPAFTMDQIENALFQFLIGKVKRHLPVGFLEPRTEFQFLIGKVKRPTFTVNKIFCQRKL